MPQNKLRQNEHGNVFLIILMGVILFAALSFTVARGLRGDTATKMSQRQAALAAAEILDTAQKFERAVDRARRKNISENDISFEHDADYVNTSCDNASDPEFPDCQIFNKNGTGITYISPDDGVTASEWHFTGATCIADIGTGPTGCDADTNTHTEELLAVLPGINDTVCTEINDRLNISGIPADTGGGASTTKYTGSFANDTEIILAGGPYNSACFSRGGTNYFYYVLIAR